jgi:hypothetical protein
MSIPQPGADDGPTSTVGAPIVGAAPRRTPPWVVVTVVLLALAVWWLAARVVDLQARVQSLETIGLDAGSSPPMFFPATTTTPPPVDIPPPDGETARRSVRDALSNVFGSTMPAEQRATWVQDPAGIRDRLALLGGGPCGSGVEVVITELRFIDDDTAWIRFRFQGPGVPEVGTGFTFEGMARRAPERWLLDTQTVNAVIDMATPYCS